MTSEGSEDPALAMLREVDHRVKNNLQMISSLIQLQTRRADDPAVQAALKTVQGRVGAVATVHRRLFQGDPHCFETAGFMRDLAGDLAGQAGRDDIRIDLDLAPAVLPAGQAAPFALVANELLDNALRHAFPAGQGGRIAVRVTAEGGCGLTIADDGVGMAGQPDGFGLTVARLLCRQLHAQFTVEDAGPGTRVTVAIPA